MASLLKNKSAKSVVPLARFQRDWVRDRSRFKVAAKARRIGFTFATTLEIALGLIEARTRWLIVSRTQDTAKEALREIKTHFAAMKHAAAARAEIAEEPTDLFFEGVRISKFVVNLPNGSECLAMTAHPDAARGFGGHVFLDEHGFHRDSKELWKGASAAVMRGHRMIVVSTPHYQMGNYFDLARKCGLTAGRAPSERRQGIWSAHWVDIHAAAPQLREIGQPLDLGELRELAGDEEAWQQEFCCQFLSAVEMWIPLELIAAARSPHAWRDWDPAREYEGWLYFGADIARKRDLFSVYVLEQAGGVSLCRGIISLRGATFEQQHQLLDALASHPRMRRGCIDATGMGAPVAERLQEKHGAKIEPVVFTLESKENMAVLARRRFEEKLTKIPQDAPQLEQALAAIKRQATASGHLRFDAARTEQGHADEAWAMFLAESAADSGVQAACLGSDPLRRGERNAEFGIRNERNEPERPSFWRDTGERSAA
jgi:phage FluMu gp28-like protein